MPESWSQRAAKELSPIICGLVETTQNILITELFGKDAAEAYPFKLSAMPQEIEDKIAAIIERCAGEKWVRYTGDPETEPKTIALIYREKKWRIGFTHMQFGDIWTYLPAELEAAPCHG